MLRFEDLSTTAGNAWIGRAISEEISGQLQGTRHQAVLSFLSLRQLDGAMGTRPAAAPGISTERGAALAGGANRIVSGYYSVRDGQLSIESFEEDVETRQQRPLGQGSGTIEDLLHLADGVAREIDIEAHPPVTGSARALRSYALALESPPDAAPGLLEEATQLDPDFGAPYVAMARLALAKRDLTGFATVFARVRARGSGIPAVDRALLNLEDTRLHGAASAQIDALGALVRLTPADPFALRQLATAELTANRYSEAADNYRKLSALLPTDTDGIKGQGYALLYAGDDAGSAKAFAEYRRVKPADSDTLDSAGDQHFFFGRFAEAEKLYLAAQASNPAALDGGELLKAAYARLMTLDAGGAMAMVARYRKARAAARDGLADFRAAEFLRRAGNREGAAELLRRYTQGAPSAVMQAALAQLAWWRLLDSGEVGALPESPLRAAVLAVVRKDWAGAEPLWKSVAQRSSPDDWWTRIVYGRVLLELGRKSEAAKLVRFNPVPQPAQALLLDDLWFPAIFDVRSRAGR